MSKMDKDLTDLEWAARHFARARSTLDYFRYHQPEDQDALGVWEKGEREAVRDLYIQVQRATNDQFSDWEKTGVKT